MAGIPLTRTSSTSSRNDLFTTSWAPDVPPPKPLHQVAPRTFASKTSSFFDASTSPRLAPSPRPLSPAPSLRGRIPPPLPLHPSGPATPTGEDDALSPLHQSPSLPAVGASWLPPLPPSSDDIEVRLFPSNTYLLGEGRYAQVYLGAFRRSRKDSLRTQNDTAWHLCAAKRMAADRESQTMGLREAFFLGRLNPASKRGRAPSPLRSPRGSVHVIRLIAVKEDVDGRRSTHGRSVSDAIKDEPKVLTRQRSSTFTDEHGLSSFPSLPSLAHGAKDPPLSLSRLVLLIEHAPLGTLDRLLRTSPDLVGRQLWECWARQGADALEWVHSKGVVHCDVKPGNLLLTHDLDLRLSDFGSSLLIHPAHPPTDGIGLGTLPFSPPELVDPNQTFSFPVDIFAFGATLYQCITGREPFRGTRTVEMVHHVRKGALWSCEERDRLGRIGLMSESVAGSPYPSAWRQAAEGGLRRAGSLRVPASKPRLPRMPSAESLRASDDLVDGPNSNESPAGVKLWANWVKGSSQGRDPLSLLLAEGDGPVLLPRPTAPPSRQSSASISPTSQYGQEEERPRVTLEQYGDGSPAMVFLDGRERVPEEVRAVIKAMVDPLPGRRPTAEGLRRLWEEIGVGQE